MCLGRVVILYWNGVVCRVSLFRATSTERGLLNYALQAAAITGTG